MATIGGPKVLREGMVFSVDSLNGPLTGTYEDTWTDLTGRGNNLTLAATTSYGDAGFWPQFTRSGAQFTRANINYAYNTSHNMPSLLECTVICWLKYTSTDGGSRIPIYVVDSSGKFVYIDVSSSYNYFGAATETQAINQEANSNPGTNDGKWHQLAVVRNGSSLALKLYFDGALISSTQDNIYGGWTAGASDISVGCGFSGVIAGIIFSTLQLSIAIAFISLPYKAEKNVAPLYAPISKYTVFSSLQILFKKQRTIILVKPFISTTS